MNDIGLPFNDIAVDELTVHPLANIFPMLDDDELAELAADIKANGQQIPIMLDQAGKILVDGRNRLAACKLAGVEPWFERLREGEDPVAFIVSANLQRRNLTKSQQAMALALIYPETRPGKRSEGSATTLSASNKVSTARLSQARAILRHSKTLAHSVASGAKSIDAALAEIAEREKADAKPEARVAALRLRYTDLAAHVVEGLLSIEAAEVEANVRDRKEVERREVIFRIAEAALYNVTAFAADGFVTDMVTRLDDKPFRKELIARLRLDTEDDHLSRIKAGARELTRVLTLLREGEDA